MNTVVLEVRTLADTPGDAARAMHSGRAEREARIGFASPELLWQVPTAKRRALLKAMCRAGPRSIRDVMALLHAGVLSRTDDGKVEFPFDSVKVEFMLQAA